MITARIISQADLTMIEAALDSAERQIAKLKEEQKQCNWKQDDEGNWETTCGNMFVIAEGTPSENDMNYCCYCGGLLKEH